MLLDFGWSEILLIGIVALIVIGPKDLPKAMRVAGYWMRKARSMSHDFQMQVEEMMRESELDEVRDELKKASNIDLRTTIGETVDPDGRLAESVKPPELPDFSGDHPAEGEAETGEKPAPAEAAAPGEGSEAVSPEPKTAEPAEIAHTGAAEQAPREAAPNGSEPGEAEPAAKAPRETPAEPAASAPTKEHAAPPKPSE